MTRAAAPQEIPVFVVLPPGTLLLDVAEPVEVLRRANAEQHALRFAVRYVGPAPEVESSISLTLSGIGPLPHALSDGAMLIVVGSIAKPPERSSWIAAENAAQEAEIVRWLRQAIRPGVRLVSICSSALLAARAGLLSGHDRTTHHACCAELTALALRARVLENRLYVKDGERSCSAGATAGIDLRLHMLAQMAGAATVVAPIRSSPPGSRDASICTRAYTYPGCDHLRFGMRLEPRQAGGARRGQTSAFVTPVPRAQRHECDRLRFPYAHRTCPRFADRIAAGYRIRRRTQWIRLSAAVSEGVAPRARRSGKSAGVSGAANLRDAP